MRDIPLRRKVCESHENKRQQSSGVWSAAACVPMELKLRMERRAPAEPPAGEEERLSLTGTKSDHMRETSLGPNTDLWSEFLR